MSDNVREHLLRRLDEIGASIASEPSGLALLGLGSAGLELDRLDEFSDLDFFAVVDAGAKPRFLDSLDWLSRIHPVEFAHRNTVDGFKVMFADGIFCEFAVFEPGELHTAVFPPARIVWAAERFDDSAARAGRVQPGPRPSTQYLVDEALTNLYVGLLRDHRGERLAALRMIQVAAVERLMELVALSEQPSAAPRDPFWLPCQVQRRATRLL